MTRLLKINTLIKLLGAGILFMALCTLGINIWMIQQVKHHIFNESNLESVISRYPVALILGTSNKRPDGSSNLYFQERIETASYLYHQGKIEYMILSGSHHSQYYNEPKMMKEALQKRGVPDSILTLDNKGSRTLSSILRCRDVYGCDKLIIITQPFHCYRALFICRFFNIDAIGVNIKNSSKNNAMSSVHLREYFARVKTIIDLYIFNTQTP